MDIKNEILAGKINQIYQIDLNNQTSLMNKNDLSGYKLTGVV